MKSSQILNLVLLALLFFSPGLVSADGDGGSAGAPTVVGTPGSDASFDKRLPPVFPGERVNDSGKEIRVWSSAGPVPVSPPAQAPQPFEQGGAAVNGSAISGVIVDHREDARDAQAQHPRTQ